MSTVTENQLHGSLPTNVGLTLPNLQIFFGGANNFANLQSLVGLKFDVNSLGNGIDGDLNFLNFLGNCSSLVVLGLQDNNFGGVFPNSIANLSTQLQSLTMGGNMIRGDIPIGIGNLVNLNDLGLEDNHLGVTLPNVIGILKFFGPIPSSLGNLTRLTMLFMQGNIPTSLGNCQNLLLLNISSNNIVGIIPKQVIGLSSLSISLVMSHNLLIGELPFEVGNLIHLAELDLSYNRLSGKIPTTLETCLSLERLYLGGNSFEGAIPESLKTLRGLEEIDISRNNFSRQIPELLSKSLSLEYLNISYNDFEGEVPIDGVFANASKISIFGNEKLCGGLQELHLPICLRKNPHSSGKLLALKVVIPTSSMIIFVLILLYFFPACFLVSKKRERALAASSFDDRKLSISCAELLKSTNGFLENNLIGSGSFGSIYKVVLFENGALIVAIKVLNLQQKGASKSFNNECNALRRIRHCNLFKIIFACSSIDHEGNDFKSIIFEFMSIGSLEKWLHPKIDEQHQSKNLRFIHRLNITVDVAYALEYLHHHCQTTIVHCELYGMGGQVSTLGDIYSYGILLLEMFIGKRPIDEIFKDDLSIHKFTAMALPKHVMDIVGPSMFFVEDEEDVYYDIEERTIIEEDPYVDVSSRIKECLISVFQIGLLCSKTSPDEPMPTNVVVSEITAIRDTFLKSQKKNRRRMN
ncbi:hypothetical protein ACJW31_09G071700 [Castanea mollissima]